MALILDFMWVNVFLWIGWFVRERIKILQYIFMPSSVIGGILLLVCGPQVLNIVPISAAVSKYPNFLIIIILTCSVLGSNLDKARIRSYADYTSTMAGMYSVQLLCGVAISAVLSLIWEGMPPNWGIVSIYAYWAGHATAGAAAQVFEAGGYPDFMGIGMIYSSLGLVAALTIGMPLLNWGIRKGYGAFVDKPEKLPPEYFGGLMPVGKRTSIGELRTSGAGISALSFQMTLISMCIMLGYGIRVAGIRYIHPSFKEIADLVLGIIGAIIIWPLMRKFKVDEYVDKKTLSGISGFCLEYLIVAAVATISTTTLVAYFIPILIHALIMLVILVPLYIVTCRAFCRKEWFEKMINMFGQGVGNAATGITLLRCVDSKLESASADASGMGLTIFLPVWVPMIVIGPTIAMSGAGSTIKLMLLGAAFIVLFFGISWFIARLDKKTTS
jgi:ESS family glutamate:Na+ symporter